MKQLRALITEKLADDSVDVKPLILQYRILSEQQVANIPREEIDRAVSGFHIRLAIIKRDLGKTEDYIEELEDAWAYADGKRYEDVTSVIDDTLDHLAEALRNLELPLSSEAIAGVLRKLGEEAGFDEQTCSEIADLPFEVAFETAYGYLMQAGEDPDKVLAPFMDENKGE